MSIIQGNAKQGSTRGFYPKIINGSLRFNDDDSAYLSWTPASAGNRKTWTFSAWVKRANVSTASEQMILAARDASGVQTTIYFRTDDKIQFYSENGGGIGSIATTAVYRDPSAWYHMVFRFDAANNSFKIYVNGVEQTLSTFVAVSNVDHAINSTITQGIGYSPTSGQYADLYLANVHFIDGQALTASDFGETKNGVWVAKDYAGTFGTNGFYLTFEDDTEVEAFNTVLYKATGQPLSVTGVGFQPDLVWIKQRDQGYAGGIYDSVRGANKCLISSSTGAELSQTDELMSFDSDGFTLGTSASGYTNYGATTPKTVAWCWKAGDSNVSNTDGTITSTVRANDTYGFSIVSWTGNGSTNQSVGHGLSTAPSLIISKKRDASGSWYVTGSLLGTDGYMFLDTTEAQLSASGYFPAPDSDVFYVSGTNSGSLNNSNNYISYCWSETTGYSKFGSYTGTGSTVSVTTGFKPSLVLFKRTDSTGSWFMLDDTRDTDASQSKWLAANLSNAEDDEASRALTFTDTGFQVTGTSADVNTSGGTYIYAAFADTREAAFWLDQSGNDNDWQPVNLDHNDTVADSPTNNFATWNPLAQTGCTLSDGNLTAQTPAGAGRVHATMAFPKTGQWYAEVTFDYNSSGNTNMMVGIAPVSDGTTTYMGFTSGSYGYYSYNGNLYNNSSSSAYGATYAVGDTIGIAYDADTGTLTYYKNGVSQGSAVTGLTDEYVLGLSDGSGTLYVKATVNFGQQPFKYDPPA